MRGRRGGSEASQWGRGSEGGVGGHVRERSQPEAWGQLIPSHLGPPGSMLLAVAGFLPRPVSCLPYFILCPLPSGKRLPHTHLPKLGWLPGRIGSGTGRAGPGSPFISPSPWLPLSPCYPVSLDLKVVIDKTIFPSS